MSLPVDSEALDVAPLELPVGSALAARGAVWVELAKPRLSALAVAATGVAYLAAGGELGASFGWLLVGSFLMAAGSSYLNQLVEADLDAGMERTRGRPLPSGRIGEEEVLGGGILLSLAGSLLLANRVHPYSALLGLATVLGYVLLYTPLKRRTSLNTFVGAVVGGLPVLMGAVARDGRIGEVGAVLFLIVFFWQLPHFWAIAWIHRLDYRRAGFAMLSRGDTTGHVTGLYVLASAILLVPVSLMPSFYRVAGPLYFLGAGVAGLVLVAASLRFAWRPRDVEARLVFRLSLLHLPALFALMLIDKVGP